MVERARVLDSMERHSEAINLMKRAIRVMPNEDKFYVQLSDFLIERGNIGEARNHLQTAAGLDRENAEVHFLLLKLMCEKIPRRHWVTFRRPINSDPSILALYCSWVSRTTGPIGFSTLVDRLSESIGVDSGDSDARVACTSLSRSRQFREALLDLDKHYAFG